MPNFLAFYTFDKRCRKSAGERKRHRNDTECSGSVAPVTGPLLLPVPASHRLFIIHP